MRRYVEPRCWLEDGTDMMLSRNPSSRASHRLDWNISTFISYTLPMAVRKNAVGLGGRWRKRRRHVHDCAYSDLSLLTTGRRARFARWESATTGTYRLTFTSECIFRLSTAMYSRKRVSMSIPMRLSSAKLLSNEQVSH